MVRLSVLVYNIFYTVIKSIAKVILYAFYRNHEALHSENFPADDNTPMLVIAAPHGNFLMDAITMFVSCPRQLYFLSARSNYNYPIFGQIIHALGAIPVTRPQDLERLRGDGLVTVNEDGRIVTGDNIGTILHVGDTLYVEFEGPEDNVMLKEANGIIEEILDENTVKVKEPGMKWLTKGRPKDKMRRLVEYGSFVIRVERGNTLRTLESLNILPTTISRGIDRLATSPGRLPIPFPTEDDDLREVVCTSPGTLPSERTPLLNSDLRNSRNTSSSSLSSFSRIVKPSIPRVPSLPTTYTYTHMPPHSEIYSAVYNHFSNGASVCIFPEGVSHDNDHMLSLKFGCAVMALGYLASRDPDVSGKPRTLKIVPCGLNFFNRHRYRSRVFIEIGPTIEVEERLVDMYRRGGDAKRRACQELLKKIHSALQEITMNASDYDTLLFFKTASRLYRETLPNELAFHEKLALLRKIAKKYSSTTPPTDEARRLKHDVLQFAQRVRKERIAVPNVSVTPLSLFWYLPLFIGLVLLTLPGLILFLPIGLVSHYVGKKQGENAMLYDDNSLAITRWPGRDVIATWKIIAGLFLFLIFDTIYTTLSMQFITKFKLWEFHGRNERALAGLFLFVLLWPVIAYGTTLLWERTCWVGKTVWVGVWGLIHPKRRRRLLTWRDELSARVRKWVESSAPAPLPSPKPMPARSHRMNGRESSSVRSNSGSNSWRLSTSGASPLDLSSNTVQGFRPQSFGVQVNG